MRSNFAGNGRGRGSSRGGHGQRQWRSGSGQYGRRNEETQAQRPPIGTGFRQTSGGRVGIPALKAEDYLVRRQLKPYPSKEGNTFYLTNGAKSDREVLNPAALAAGSTYLNNEWCNGRLGHALSFLCANLEEGAQMIQKYIPARKEVNEKGRLALTKSGLLQFKDFLNTDEGQTVMAAAKHLNSTNEDDHRNAKSIEEAVTVLFGFLADPTKVRILQNLTLFSGKLISMSMGCLETIGMLGDRDHWSENLRQQLDHMNAEVKTFVRQPDDDRALLKAVVTTYSKHFLENAQLKGKRTLSDDEDDNEDEDQKEDASDDDEAADLLDAKKGVRLFGQKRVVASAKPGRVFGAAPITKPSTTPYSRKYGLCAGRGHHLDRRSPDRVFKDRTLEVDSYGAS